MKLLIRAVGAGLGLLVGFAALACYMNPRASGVFLNAPLIVTRFAHHYWTHGPTAERFHQALLVAGAWQYAVTLAVLLCVKLREKWFHGRTSEAERAPGIRGLAAWLSRPNLLLGGAWVACVTVIAVAMVGLNAPERTAVVAWTFVGAVVLVLALLTAAPLTRSLSEPSPAGPVTANPPPRPTGDLSSERQRVLRLLEDGRITADEASELLSALAATLASDAPPPAGPASRGRKLVVVGAVVVLVGFFLPWFRLNPMAEAQRMTGMSFGPTADHINVNGQSVPWPPTGQTQETAWLSITGGDVGRGLGWLVLAAALCAAAAPAVTGFSPPTQRQAAWLAAGVGTVISLYLLTSSLSWVSGGLVLVLVGEAIQWAGLVSDLPRRAFAPADPLSGLT